MINICQDVSTNWNITSDSLALWLAGHLNAEHVLLVKSASISKSSSGNLNARQSSESEMVDKDFPEFVKNQNPLYGGLIRTTWGSWRIYLQQTTIPRTISKRLLINNYN